MTCYISDRKANDCSMIFDFAITIAVIVCSSICICVLSVFAFFVLCLLRLHLLYFGKLSAYLRLPWLASSAFIVDNSSTFSVVLSTSSALAVP